MQKIGFLGPRGTFSHEALLKYAVGREYEAVAFSSIQEMILAVGKRQVDEAVVPIENSIEGAVNATMDMISAAELDLRIKAEFVIHIRENLLVKRGVKIGDIKFVLSHTQALGQCSNYIANSLSGASIRITNSTAGAAEEAAAGNGEIAAIGSAAAAVVYDLEIAAAGIQDVENNSTRFVVIGSEDSAKTGNDKTSIVFSTDDNPGSLYQVLGIFNLWNINMSRIESRPAKNQLGRYIFFVDIIGHREDEDIRDAMTMIKRKTSFFKLLGSYPVFELQD
ncbi:MAG: prephenate dehydratase [Clostridiales bacterium]|nr:prephenate dehydratase [Clostridiales bacterium]